MSETSRRVLAAHASGHLHPNENDVTALAREVEALEAEVETLEALVPPIGSYVFPPQCAGFDLARRLAELTQLADGVATAWGMSWDCSRDPGHARMADAMAALVLYLAQAPEAPKLVGGVSS